MREPWFIASVNFIEGLLDRHTNFSHGQTEEGVDDQLDGDVDDEQRNGHDSDAVASENGNGMECDSVDVGERVDIGVVDKGHDGNTKDDDSAHGHVDGVDAVHEPNHIHVASNLSLAHVFKRLKI